MPYKDYHSDKGSLGDKEKIRVLLKPFGQSFGDSVRYIQVILPVKIGIICSQSPLIV